MAKGREADLFRTLRASGVRKKVARAVSDASRKAGAGKQSKLLERTLESLKSATAEVERRVDGGKRSEAAKKAAKTRMRKAAARSTAARKAAKTRARTRG